MIVLKISARNLGSKIKTTVKAVKEGKILICPTDTVYGLIGRARDEKVVKKLFKIKDRQSQKTLPIFVKSLKMAKELAFVDEKQEKFLRKVWPGKTTVVLKTKSKARKLFKFGIVSSEKKIGLRIPKYKLINLLLQKLNFPLTGTSANVSGKPASGNIKKVLNQFKNKKYQPDLVVDAGDLPKSKPSTVLDLTTFPSKILRE